jgi:hypothetical protein
MCCVKVANELDSNTCEREREREKEREKEREGGRERRKETERERAWVSEYVCGYRFVIENCMQVYSPHVHMQFKCSK